MRGIGLVAAVWALVLTLCKVCLNVQTFDCVGGDCLPLKVDNAYSYIFKPRLYT